MVAARRHTVHTQGFCATVQRFHLLHFSFAPLLADLQLLLAPCLNFFSRTFAWFGVGPMRQQFTVSCKVVEDDMDDSSLLVPADGEEVERKDDGRSRWTVEQGMRNRAHRLKEQGRRSVVPRRLRRFERDGSLGASS